MLIRAKLHCSCRVRGVVNHRVTDIAVISNYLSGIAHMLTVMATKTAVEIKMADVVRMSLPVSPHFRKEIGAKDPLQLVGRCFYVVAFIRMQVRILFRVKLVQT